MFADMQETLSVCAWTVPAGTSGETIDHFEPFQLSSNPLSDHSSQSFTPVCPTAMHNPADAHDTPFNEVTRACGVVGIDVLLHTPAVNSALYGIFSPELCLVTPTAMHSACDEQETPI